MSRRRALVTASLFGLVVLVLAAPAQASGVLGTGLGPDVGPDLNPLPSAGGLAKSAVDVVFIHLASALTPDFLKHGSVDALRWLVALPNPASPRRAPHLAELEADMAALGAALLPVTILIGALRYWAAGFSGAAHPITVVVRATGIGAWVVAYPWAFANGVALVNVVTNAMLTLPVVQQGLGRTVSVMFGSAVITGAGGVFLALLTIVAVCLAVGLFAMKVAVLMLAAVLWAAGPLLFPLYLIPETAHLVKAWLVAAIATALIPVGWCVLFAVAGALALDVTSFATVGHQGASQVVGEKTVGSLACLVTFFLAVRWPFLVLGQVRTVGAGLSFAGPAGAGGAAGRGAGGPVADAARARLRGAAAGTLTAGRVLQRAAGHISPRSAIVSHARRRTAKTGTAVTGIPAVSALGSAAAKSAATIRQRARALPPPGPAVATASAEALDTLKSLPRAVRSSYREQRDGPPRRGRGGTAMSASRLPPPRSKGRAPAVTATSRPGAARPAAGPAGEPARRRLPTTRPPSGASPAPDDRTTPTRKPRRRPPKPR